MSFRLDHMKQQHERFRQDMNKSMELKTQEIQHLEDTKRRLQREADEWKRQHTNAEV